MAVLKSHCCRLFSTATGSNTTLLALMQKSLTTVQKFRWLKFLSPLEVEGLWRVTVYSITRLVDVIERVSKTYFRFYPCFAVLTSAEFHKDVSIVAIKGSRALFTSGGKKIIRLFPECTGNFLNLTYLCIIEKRRKALGHQCLSDVSWQISQEQLEFLGVRNLKSRSGRL